MPPSTAHILEPAIPITTIEACLREAPTIATGAYSIEPIPYEAEPAVICVKTTSMPLMLH